MKKYTFLLFILLLIPSFLSAQVQEVNDGELGIYEHLDEYIPQNLVFTDLNGQEVVLDSLINKPTLLSFVYFSCPGICNPLLNGISDVIDKSDMKLGKDYQVITISFNPKDTPELGRQKKENYVHSLKHKKDVNHWIWLTGNQENIDKITNATGFKYIPQGDDFIHTATLIAISPKGKITRYLNGTYFLPFDVKMSVVEAAKGNSSPTINRVLEFCFSYDPEGKRYVFNITRIAGIIILIIAIITLLILFLGKKKKTKIPNA
ncbi:MAG: SCO family protein [Bacteroidales bacterium]